MSGEANARLIALYGRVQEELRAKESEVAGLHSSLEEALLRCDQLRLENTKKWRVEERNDWRQLVDSLQRDRRELQARCDELEGENGALKERRPPAPPTSSPGSAFAAGSSPRARRDVLEMKKLREELDRAECERIKRDLELQRLKRELSEAHGASERRGVPLPRATLKLLFRLIGLASGSAADASPAQSAPVLTI